MPVRQRLRLQALVHVERVLRSRSVAVLSRDPERARTGFGSDGLARVLRGGPVDAAERGEGPGRAGDSARCAGPASSVERPASHGARTVAGGPEPRYSAL